MGDTQLSEEWAQLKEAQLQLGADRQQLDRERAAFQEERDGSGLEFKLFVGNLGLGTDEILVKEMFQEFGTVKEVFMLKDREGNSKRSCFVKFYSNKEAKAAIAALDGKKKDNDARDFLAVRLANAKGAATAAPPGRGGMGGGGAGGGFGAQSMGGGASMGGAAQWNEHQPSAYDPYGASNGYGMQAAQTAQYGGYSSYGPVMGNSGGQQGSYAAAPASAAAATSSTGSGRGPPGANLYVNNLQPTATHQDVQAMFGDFGNVVSIKLFSTSNGFQYGFVSFDDEKAAGAAISALDGMDINNSRRSLEVRLKTDKGGAGGRGGGSRFAPY